MTAARLIRRVFAVHPLVCAKCGSRRRAIAVILDPKVIRKNWEHIHRRDEDGARGRRASGRVVASPEAAAGSWGVNGWGSQGRRRLLQRDPTVVRS